MTSTTPAVKTDKPNLFAYALILPAVWYSVGFLVHSFAPGTRLNIGMTIAMYVFVGLGIGWLFLRKHGRLFTSRESWKMVAYCSIFAFILESWSLLALLTWPEEYPDITISADSARFAIVFAAVVDTLAMTIIFRFTIPRYLKKFLPSNNQMSV